MHCSTWRVRLKLRKRVVSALDEIERNLIDRGSTEDYSNLSEWTGNSVGSVIAICRVQSRAERRRNRRPGR